MNPLSLFILVALTTVNVRADEQFTAGREDYAEGEFRKAAAHFQVACNNNNAEGCYWAGLSYQTLADAATPFGCVINAKAHQYLSKAMKLAPERPLYREALFDFLLNTADCSRTALREAAGILAAVPESDSNYNDMRRRLAQERHLNAALNARLATLFLAIPRATYRVAALPAAALNMGAEKCSERAACGSAVQTTGTRRAQTSF